MAKRYCGQLSLYIDIDEDSYFVRISSPRPKGVARIVKVIVGFPKMLRVAVDSSEAIDGAAHAALSFAQDDELDVDFDMAATTDQGWMITRKPVAELLRRAARSV